MICMDCVGNQCFFQSTASDSAGASRMEDTRPSTPRGTPRGSGIDVDQMPRGTAELPFRNLKEEIALRSRQNTALNTPRSGRSTVANTPRSPRAGPSLKEQLTPRSLKEHITPRGTLRAASPFLDQTTPRSGASTPRGYKSPYQFASPRAAAADQAPAGGGDPGRSPSQSPPEADSPPPQQQQQHHALPPEQLARRLRRISQDVAQELPHGITIGPQQIQSAPTLMTAMTLAPQELLQSAATLAPLDNQLQAGDGGDQVPSLLGSGRAASLLRAESTIAGWWRSGLRRRSTMGAETLLIIPRLSISEGDGEGQAEEEGPEQGGAEDTGSDRQAAAAVEAAAAVAAPGIAAASDSASLVAPAPVMAAPAPVVDSAAAAQVTPMLEIASAPPAVRTSVRRPSRRRLVLGGLTLLLAGCACLMMFQ